MDSEKLFNRLDELLDRVELLLPNQQTKTRKKSKSSQAWRFSAGQIEAITSTDPIKLDQLMHIERQAELLSRNTAQFIKNLPANNALLWGARGTGKSSLIKALFNTFKDRGLNLVEVDRHNTGKLYRLTEQLASRKEKFLVYLDDLSFEEGDVEYKALKAMLDGSIQSQPKNMLIYATSNRRHLMPESMQENRDSRISEDGQLHPADGIDEKISLSDRFGLWLSFYPFSQSQYLAIVEAHLKPQKLKMDEECRLQAIRFATQRGSRSGRIARQFAAYWIGEKLL